MRAAWGRHGPVSDQDAQLYCCARRIQGCAVPACAGGAPCSARSSERDVLHGHHHSILRKWSQGAVPAAQCHWRLLEMFRPTQEETADGPEAT